MKPRLFIFATSNFESALARRISIKDALNTGTSGPSFLSMINSSVRIAPAALVVFACSEAPVANFNRTISTVVAAGTDASIVSHNVPISMRPGETRTVRVVVENNGSVIWDNNEYMLRAPVLGGLDWVPQRLSNPPVPQASTVNFDITLTAPPTDGSYNFTARMYVGRRIGGGFFGATLTVPVEVRAAVLAYDARLISHDVPATLAPRQRRLVHFIVENTGSDTWQPTEIHLVSRGAVRSTRSRPLVPVPSGAQVTFPTYVTAPATPGAYVYQTRMTHNGIDFGPIFEARFTVGVPVAALDAQVINHTIPVTMVAGGSGSFEITMVNLGSTSWSASTAGLASMGENLGPSAISFDAGELIATGGEKTFVVQYTAPSIPGQYVTAWQMNAVASGGFGEWLSADIEVVAAPSTWPLLNGSFEAGGFTGWTLLAEIFGGACSTFTTVGNNNTISASSTVFDYLQGVAETQNSPGLPLTTHTHHGESAALLLVHCADVHVLQQDIQVPACDGTLAFDLGWTTYAPFYPGSQELAVELRSPVNDALLATAFSTDPSTAMSASFSTYAADVTQLGGQTVRVVVRATLMDDWAEVELDNFRFECL